VRLPRNMAWMADCATNAALLVEALAIHEWSPPEALWKAVSVPPGQMQVTDKGVPLCSSWSASLKLRTKAFEAA